MDHSFVPKSMLTPFGISAALACLVMCTSAKEPDMDAGDSKPAEVPVRFATDSLTAVGKTQSPPTMTDVALTTRTPIEFTEADVEPIVIAKAKLPRRVQLQH